MSDEFEKTLQAKITRLQKDQLPQRDLWPGIEIAIVNSKRQVPWFAVAATLLVCVVTGWWWLNAHNNALHGDGQASRYVAQIDQQHRIAVDTLKAAFKNTKALTTNWNDQLNDMELAAESIKKALKDEPDNATLLKMLNDVYQKEIDLLRHVHEPAGQYDETV